MSALTISGLRKQFGEHPAVDGIDLAVPAGAFFGLVGPNGAGKTTTLSMIAGLLAPDTGAITVSGVDVWERPDDAKAQMGILLGGRELPGRLTGPEVLRYMGLLRGMPAALVDERSLQLRTALGLADADRTLVADYSTGMAKKLGLAVAMLHNPRLLVLDEPFESLDPIAAMTVRGILTRFTAAGGTVLLSSHVMAIVEQTCDHVGVLAAGRIAAAGPLAAVRGDDSLEHVFAELVGAGAEGADSLTWLGSPGS